MGGARGGPPARPAAGTHNHCPVRRVSLLCLSFLSASGALESSRGRFHPVPTVPRDLVSYLPRGMRPSSSGPPPPATSLRRRGSLSSHYYCPILPLTSLYVASSKSAMPLESTVAYNGRDKSSCPESSFRALFNTCRLIFHRVIPPSFRTVLSPVLGGCYLGGGVRKCVCVLVDVSFSLQNTRLLDQPITLRQ